MISTIKKRLAIRVYRTTLAECLEKRNGWQANYSQKQVRECALAINANDDYLCYAYAMYCTRAEFDAHHAATGETCDGRACDYQQMRDEIAVSEPASGHSHATSTGGGGWFSADDGGSDGDGGGGDGGGD